LRCTFSDPDQNLNVEIEPLKDLPDQLLKFWKIAPQAKLFEDADFGQWGLEILSPRESFLTTQIEKDCRPIDYVSGDLIIGRFLGDSELLIIRADPFDSDFGNVIHALPLDGRTDWEICAPDFLEFLIKYAHAYGQKFWEN
jgi:hypothetical protein